MSRSIEETYQKKTPIEHILLRPDTYVGSIQQEKCQRYVLTQDEMSFVLQEVQYVPALYKIFDEVLVNAADNYQRDKKMDTIKVQINKEQGFIKVTNNGKGIPVVIHQEYKIYVAHMIFGELLTGSNYNDNDKKVVGGRNGYGAKLANIFSTRFIVQCGDSQHKKEFRMEWRNNMTTHCDAEIKPYSGKDYTAITFYPEFSRFQMRDLERDIYKVMQKRVYDIAGIFPSIRVSLNGRQIKLRSFKDYVNMYLGSGQSEEKKEKFYDNSANNERWDVIVSLSDGQPRQVSFVNAICTSKGGTHVNYLVDQLVDNIQQYLSKKHKDITVKPHQIKSKLWIFANCLIENPSFDSQTKETLTTKVTQFGSTYKFSQKCIKQILKSGVINEIVNEAKAKELSKMAKSTAGGKKARISGIPKLEDANEAGTRNSEKCTLILTEGDSAKGLAMSGIEVVGRDYYGVFPLKGKLLNVREANPKQIMANEEIQNIIKIMGLQFNKDYDAVKSLRYGSIMIMSDQDTDGSHIKGLVINFIHNFWPSLFKLRGFLKEFITPLLKVSKGSEKISFFTMQDFKAWSNRITNIKSWRIKYYKGLGTSDNKEAKEYFGAINRHRLEFVYTNDEDDKAIDLIFNKKKADDRKQWLETYNPDDIVVYNTQLIKYTDFVNKQYIHFSYADNHRSIGSMIDGLKPGQRKVLFGCFKRNLVQEIKVAQLAGYVAEHSAYHHGQMSLTETIINMAQNFVGSNNINLLMPNGQFGSRHQGGKQHASARYVFTQLSRLTRKIFPQPDDHCLTYVEDDGQMVEPNYYVPIIPMVLVNGNKGIGTGWSTYIPNFNPRELCTIMMEMLDGKNPPENLMPWYKGYTGEIVAKNPKSLESRGVLEIGDDRLVVHITDLPISKWIKDYKEYLDKLIDEDKAIVGLKEHHTDNKVHFEVELDEEFYRKNEHRLYTVLKLSCGISMSNLVAFNRNGIIHRYENIREILQQFYQLRLEFYSKRKDYLRSKLKRDLEILDMKVRFIVEILEDKLVIKNIKRVEVCARLEKGGYLKFSELTKIQSTKLQEKIGIVKNEPQPEAVEEDDKDDQAPSAIKAKEYDYLLGMNIWSLTYEKVEDLKSQLKNKTIELKVLEATTENEMWRTDIKDFLNEIDIVEKIELEEQIKADNKTKGTSKDKGKKQRKRVVKKEVSSDSEAEEKSKKKRKRKDDEEEKGQDSDKSDKKSVKSLGSDKEKKSRAKKSKKESDDSASATADVRERANSVQSDVILEQVDDSMKEPDFMQRIAKNIKEKGLVSPSTNIERMFDKPKNNIFETGGKNSSDEYDMLLVEDKRPNKAISSTFKSQDEDDSSIIVRRVQRSKKKKTYDTDEDEWVPI